MNKSVKNKKSNIDKFFDKLSSIRTALVALVMVIQANPLLLASADSAEQRSKDVVNGALSILFLIISVVGVLFIMYGLAKWVMAHSQGDGPAINSAMMFIASGLGLILVRFILKELGLAEWIDVELIS